MAKPLVIVESPAKAKTISRFLGDDFVVEASVGHIRDLPRNAAEVPASHKKEPWARDGVDVDHGFAPLYVVPKEKQGQISKLRGLLKGASELYLATDEDREGESISWHLLQELRPRVPVKRMVFHEITKPAIERAVDEWRDLDMPLVDAQETRRIVDRLYGYRVSEVLWKKTNGRSAGRVQSVATRILVERERERIAFRSAGWWDIEGTFAADQAAAGATGTGRFPAALASVDGKRAAASRDFTSAGTLTDRAAADGVLVLDQAGAEGLASRLAESPFAVRTVSERPYTSSPKAPFITSTLQQEAGRKLRMSSRAAMSVAQRLYENGYITYMRTDSTALSDEAVAAARSQATRLYGQEYVPPQPRRYQNKVKNAQEAHEAIRPAGDTFRTPDQLRNELSAEEHRLYDLIWKRTVASQMADARGRSVSARLGAMSSSGEDVEFSASGRTITFPGYLRAYVEGADDPEADLDDRETYLPPLREGDGVATESLDPKGHETQPPARYTEASLVKRLEELGVGRPSTYASIMTTIQDRGYVWKKGSALVPTFTAFAVVSLLEQHFTDLVDYGFTAAMEDDLDLIATRQRERVPWLSAFYFGTGAEEDPGLLRMVSENVEGIDAREISTFPIGPDPDGVEIVARAGKFGPYLQRGEDRADIPEDLPPDELDVAKALELLAQPKGAREVGADPETGLTVFAKSGRYGPYVQLGEAEDLPPKEKPKTASLFKHMTVQDVSLDEALALLTLPRVVGVDDDGEEITAQNGRYGPYLKKGTDSRTIDSEDRLLTITLDEARAIYAQPKMRRGQVARPPLRELGTDPVSGRPVVIKDGRFGPYITDGETNVTVPRAERVEAITNERAYELLTDKRAAGPPVKKAAGAKKAATPKKAGATKKAAPKKKAATKRAPE